MVKRIMARTGSYEKDGQTKGRFVEVGVIMSNNNGEYILLNPGVSLGGLLAVQNVDAGKDGKPLRDRVMCSVFSDERRGGGQSGGYGGGASGGGYDNRDGPGGGMIDDEIPF